MVKIYEIYIGDDKYKIDVLNKDFENIIKENVNSEKDEIHKIDSINKFIQVVNYNKRELQSNKLNIAEISIIIVLLNFF